MYNPARDVSPVEQFGYIDAVSALDNKAVPGNVSASESKYNGIEDPSSIMNLASDVFEYDHQVRSIRDYKPKSATVAQENPA